MAGPTATLLLPSAVDARAESALRAEIRPLASRVEGNDFWVDDRPFFLSFGEQYPGELSDYEPGRLVAEVGWSPRGLISVAAMCNQKADHRTLATVCLRMARRLGAVIDFNGALSPPIRGELEGLADRETCGGPSSWEDWEPHVSAMTRDLPGRLIAAPYTTARGTRWASHCCDATFLEAWLMHPHFHMVK